MLLYDAKTRMITANCREMAQKIWPQLSEEEQAKRFFMALNDIRDEAVIAAWSDFKFSEDGQDVQAKYNEPVDYIEFTITVPTIKE